MKKALGLTLVILPGLFLLWLLATASLEQFLGVGVLVRHTGVYLTSPWQTFRLFAPQLCLCAVSIAAGLCLLRA